MGFGRCRAQGGKRESSFSWNGLISDVWKTVNSLDWLGSARVTVECNSSVDIMGKGHQIVA